MTFTVEYTETYGGCFDIEAESEQEALDIFDKEFENFSRKFWCMDSSTEIIEAK